MLAESLDQLPQVSHALLVISQGRSEGQSWCARGRRACRAHYLPWAESWWRPRPCAQYDDIMVPRLEAAERQDMVLRYVGSYDAESGVCQVS